MTASSIFLAPATPAARAFASQLTKNGVAVAGYVDNLKSGADIYNSPADLPPKAHIYVLAGSMQSDICAGLVSRGFAKNRIRCQPSPNAKKIADWTTYKPSLRH